MSWGSRVLLSCVLVASACAGDNRIDPSELELRDVLGMAPEIAMAWDPEQRASARQVIDAGMHEAHPTPVHAALGKDGSIANALASADAGRAKQRLSPMGVVELAVDRDEVQATPHLSTLAPRVTSPIELELAGWDRPGWSQLPARGLDVLTTIASDAGHHGGPIIVTPAPQLAVIAAYMPATPASPARLLVNPVVLASLEPVVARTVAGSLKTGVGPHVVASDPVGNPYNFYTSIGACAAAQQQRCEACLPNNTCAPLSGTGDGTAECMQLAADQGRGYSLVCINYALAIDTISSCTVSSAPSCPFDANAGQSLSSLQKNSDFLDRPDCAGPLDSCLANVFGAGAPSSNPPPGNTSTDCSSSACDASSCDSSGCDGSCADSSGSTGADSGCSSGDSSSGCGDCSSDSSNSGCDSSGGDCGGDSGGDCSGGGADDCSGGGGGDCDAGGHHRHADHGYLWACLPLPFAIIARRRADRRRAKREVAS